jgi:cadmium resistance protein CadD (predicted permease)
VARREPRADTAATAVVVFAVTNVDYIIVLSVLFARRDLRFHSHRIEAGDAAYEALHASTRAYGRR